MNSLTRGKKRKALEHLANNQIQEAKVLFESICKKDRSDVEPWIYLVKINAQLGDSRAVMSCCRSIIDIRPDLYEAHFHLGTALLLQGKQEDALRSFREALRLQPDSPSITLQIGKSLHLLARFDEALEYYRKALVIAPDLADALLSTGSILKARGDIEGAIINYRRALQIRPDFEKAHSDLVCAMNYSGNLDAETIYREHIHWGQIQRLPPLIPAKNNPDTSRRIRVGYVSPDFCKHSVAFFFEPLLANHDTTRIETFCYSDVTEPDEVTGRLQEAAAHWRDIRQLNHEQLTRLIRQDAIDILVDLTGHTANSRLLAFTAKPAPVQVSYLGYPNTTGVTEIDYRLTDTWADPPGLTDDFYTETLIRIPNGFLCYRPSSDAPPVTPLPAEKCGHITFGSFNNLAKITPEVVSLWATVLDGIPGSHLIVKNISFRDEATRNHYKLLFNNHGIDTGRLEFLAPIYTNKEHLGLYGRIDIGLDTYPYNGTTTTCEAFWMGIPVITLAGTMHAGRVGVSLLSQVGHPEFIAGSPQEYARIASDLAANQAKLAVIRGALRERMAQSTLCDSKLFARNIDNIYIKLWEKWCSEQQEMTHDR